MEKKNIHIINYGFVKNSKEFKYSLSSDSFNVSKLRLYNFSYKKTQRYFEVEAECNFSIYKFFFLVSFSA